MRLNGVYDVRIYGSDFKNLRNLSNQYAYFDYGYGIYAINSGFTVSAPTAGATPPYDRSTFTGLGVGVRVLPYLDNKFFEVSQCDFTDCYNGIIVDGVSMGTMLFNHFYMGEVPDPEVINWELVENEKALVGGQIGVVISNGISGFALEENEFEVTAGNAAHTIGIVADNLGPVDNLIRRNSFDGLTISNEAFGINGYSHLAIPIGGLRYFCNTNDATDNKDFYVTDDETSGYAVNNIHTYQGLLIPLQGNYATGNIFASTGNQTDGDFANYGSSNIDYWYYDGDAKQVPDDVEGFSGSELGDPNACTNQHCIPPCPFVIGDERDVYLTNEDLYESAVSVSNWDTAAATKLIMDRSAMKAVQWYLQDTSTYNDDSLLLWYKRLLSPMGFILASKHEASQGDFTSAATYLSQAGTVFDLSDQEEDDMDNIQDIYDILSIRSIGNLTQNDIEDFEEISTHIGHAAAVARGILGQLGYTFEPEYYLPEESEEQIYLPETPVPAISNIEYAVYPNPSDGSIIQVHIPKTFKRGTFEIFDYIGRKIGTSELFSGLNSIRQFSEKFSEGCYYYRILDENQVICSSGLLMISTLKK